MCETWAEENMIPVEPYPANWARLGRVAGLRRNEEMVRLGASICMAFIDRCRRQDCTRKGQSHGTHGSIHCATTAFESGISVAMHRADW
jgi:hypothetical protein